MTHTKESIRALLDTSDKALLRGLLVIFALQTKSEKASFATREHNGVGFSPFHAEFLSSLAHQVHQGRTLSDKQMAALRKTMRRYAGQLAKVANGTIAHPLRTSPAVSTPTSIRDKILAAALAITSPASHVTPHPLNW